MTFLYKSILFFALFCLPTLSVPVPTPSLYPVYFPAVTEESNQLDETIQSTKQSAIDETNRPVLDAINQPFEDADANTQPKDHFFRYVQSLLNKGKERKF